jgi:ABC-type transporter Mla subunit MlaD
MVYERLYGPLGGQRDDHNTAVIASTVAAAFSEKPPPFSDFLTNWAEATHGDDT